MHNKTMYSHEISQITASGPSLHPFHPSLSVHLSSPFFLPLPYLVNVQQSLNCLSVCLSAGKNLTLLWALAFGLD